MKNKRSTPQEIASMNLGSKAQDLLSEMAHFMGRPLDQTANIAVHVAYLDYLKQRHDETEHAISCILRGIDPNDEARSR